MKNFFKFFISKTFFINVGIALIVTVVILWITFLSLESFTQHGETIAVPDFRGLTLEEITQLTNEKGLRFEVTDSVYLLDEKKGTVVDQNPPPDFKVKENRKIFVTMNAIMPERVQVPDLVGVSLRQATAYIETFGLKVGKLSYIPDIGKNVVLNQKYKGKDIKTGSLIEKGKAIDLVLGLGETKERTSVPKIIGMNIEEATTKLAEFSLNIGAIVCDESIKTVKDSSSAKIYKQFPMPMPKSEISLGSGIDIWITNDKTLVPTDTTTYVEPPEID
ncbi:MAG: hypothetical protein A2046_05720 [Bacteroidetes bacterium GWA2_30_7]|nr:MAG: hypothetical protein A2046_05720 [Bacteroidetes bacterium GWA2_30_7]